MKNSLIESLKHKYQAVFAYCLCNFHMPLLDNHFVTASILVLLETTNAHASLYLNSYPNFVWIEFIEFWFLYICILECRRNSLPDLLNLYIKYHSDMYEAMP